MIIADELDVADRAASRSRSPTPSPSSASTSSPAARSPPSAALRAAAHGLRRPRASRWRAPPPSASASPRPPLTVADGVISGGGAVARPTASSPPFAAVTTDRARRKDVKVKRQARRSSSSARTQKRIDARAAVTGTEAVRDGPQGPGRAADRALPAADHQRQRRGAAQPSRDPGDAGRRGRRRSSRTRQRARQRHRSPAASPSAAQTFGQCIDAIRAMKVRWSPAGRPRARRSSRSRPTCEAAELPLTPGAARARSSRTSSSSTSGRATRWSPTAPSPTCARTAARGLGGAEVADLGQAAHRARTSSLPVEAVTVPRHRGRRLVRPPPVLRRAPSRRRTSRARSATSRCKLMWTRADMPRQGRCQPMKVVRNRVDARRHAGRRRFSQRMTSVMTDFTQGLGEILTAVARDAARAELPPVLADGLQPHRERAVQLRRRRHAVERDLRLQHVQHLERPQHLLARRSARSIELTDRQARRASWARTRWTSASSTRATSA